MNSTKQTIKLKRTKGFSRQRDEILNTIKLTLWNGSNSVSSFNEYNRRLTESPLVVDVFGVTFVGEVCVTARHYATWAKNKRSYLGELRYEVHSADEEVGKDIAKKIERNMLPYKSSRIR